MILSIHQPNYLPYPGYFYKIARSDVFVILDNVQYSKNGFINRNRIKTSQGESWLTVNVLTKGRFGQNINEVLINNSSPWYISHEKSLIQNYSRAAHFKNYIISFQNIYQKKWDKLSDLNEAFIVLICQLLRINNVKIIRASELNVSGQSTQLLLDICKVIGCDTYLSGPSGKNYMDEELFKREKINIEYSEYKHPVYTQLWGGFIPDMSIIDLLFNEGGKSLEILTK